MTALKLMVDSMVTRALGRIVKGIAPAPASRKILFAGSTMEREQATPPYSDQAVIELAHASKTRFPSLRECDL